MTPNDLTNAVKRYQSARPELRQPFLRSAVELAKALSDERDALVTRLEARWRWCDRNAGHPFFEERENAALTDLALYEQTEDALRDAASALWGKGAA